MLVDPFTVIAQIVNFALLVWLLSRFLYGPVTRAMEAREARIREELEAARRLKAEAEAEGERYRALLATVDQEREARLAELRAEIDALRQEQVRAVRAEIQELRERWNRALEQERDAFLRELRLQMGQGSVQVIRNALAALADDDLEARLVQRFVQRLREIDETDRQRLANAAREDDGAFLLRTSFPLTEADRDAITRALAETVDPGAAPRFVTDPELLAGVELRAGGVKLSWTLDDYLQTLEEGLREAFGETVEVRPGGER